MKFKQATYVINIDDVETYTENGVNTIIVSYSVHSVKDYNTSKSQVLEGIHYTDIDTDQHDIYISDIRDELETIIGGI
jgi:hypothetical protein